MLALMLATLLFAADLPESPTALSSAHAAYDGSTLVLTGDVLLDHGLGQMRAERAALEKQVAEGDFPFTQIALNKQVHLLLENQVTLSCGRADLDFAALKGVLLADSSTRVLFSDKALCKTPLCMKSERAELDFSKSAQAGQRALYEVETILAEDAVEIEYGEGFHLFAEKALYRKGGSAKASSLREFQGTITAYPKDSHSYCRLVREGDQIEASSVDLDLLHARVTMLNPRGALASTLFPHLQKGALIFRSDHLLWDQNQERLILTENAYVEEANIGDIAADQELCLVYKSGEKAGQLKSIDTRGKTVLNYGIHRLTCYGTIHLDREALSLTLESPEEEGIVPEKQQICYQEGEVRVYGDKAAMEYALFDGLIHPTSCVLKEHVRLFSKNAVMQQRWALADRLTYSPTTRTFIFTANPGNRVLFHNEEEGLAISAQEVHIFCDPETGKERVQGVGNVRLSFSAEEIALLKKAFPSYE